MLICPISGFKMRQARARGGTLWYCPHSRGRAVTLEMAKRFLGEDAAREIWVRSEFKFRASTKPCPSCSRPMRQVSEPGWIGGGEIDVCRGCHFIWIDPGKHPEIPHPEDLLSPRGDSTVVKDSAEAARDFLVRQEEAKTRQDAIVGDSPEGWLGNLPAFLGLPVEMPPQARTSWPVATWGLLGGIFLLHWLGTSSHPALLRQLGFYPADPFKNGGLNALTAPLFHDGWFHLLFNLYFFWIFSDDVEEDLGLARYLLFFAVASLTGSVASLLISGRPEIPQVGLSGFVMALMSYYALQFPKARLAYLLPLRHALPVGKGVSWMLTWKWFRVPAWIVFILYVLKDLLSYFAVERSGASAIAHSAHLSGVLAGIAFWFLFSGPRVQTLAKKLSGAGNSPQPDRKLLERLK